MADSTRLPPDDERLMDLVADALAASTLTRDDVVDAGRAAWLWHGVLQSLQGGDFPPDGVVDASPVPPLPHRSS